MLFLEKGFPTVLTFEVFNPFVYFWMYLEATMVGKLLAANITDREHVALPLETTQELSCAFSLVLRVFMCFVKGCLYWKLFSHIGPTQPSFWLLRGVSKWPFCFMLPISPFQNLSSLCLCLSALHPLLTTAVALTLSWRAVWRKGANSLHTRVTGWFFPLCTTSTSVWLSNK